MALSPQIPPNRNALFRPRRVKLVVTYSALGFAPTTTGVAANPVVTTLELTEVTSIDISTPGNTAVGMGQVGAFLQPWYFGPFKIGIAGKSYIGSMADTRLNIAADTDVRKLMEIRNAINAQFRSGISLGTPGVTAGALSAVISYGDDKESDNLAAFQEYRGFIDDISINENQQNPYIIGYAIKFTGEKKDLRDVSSGSQGWLQDMNKKSNRAGSVTSAPEQSAASAQPGYTELPAAETNRGQVDTSSLHNDRPKNLKPLPVTQSGTTASSAPTTNPPAPTPAEQRPRKLTAEQQKIWNAKNAGQTTTVVGGVETAH